MHVLLKNVSFIYLLKVNFFWDISNRLSEFCSCVFFKFSFIVLIDTRITKKKQQKLTCAPHKTASYKISNLTIFPNRYFAVTPYTLLSQTFRSRRENSHSFVNCFVTWCPYNVFGDRRATSIKIAFRNRSKPRHATRVISKQTVRNKTWSNCDIEL